MAKWSILFVYFSQGLLIAFGQQQQRTAGPWRRRIQWENNGHVYSLMSTGSEYQEPFRSRSQSRYYMSSSRRDGTRSHMPGGTLARPRQVDSRELRTGHAVEPGATAHGLAVGRYASRTRQQPERPRGEGAVSYPGARRFSAEHTNAINASAPGNRTNFLGPRAGIHVDSTRQLARDEGSVRGPQHQGMPGYISTLERESETAAPFSDPSGDTSNDAVSNGETMVNDDPRNPFKNHRNSVFYTYPTSIRARLPPGTGYGTRYFQNGLPDLVPDPYAIQAGTYIQRMQMYALRCAAEENCLARSAYGPTVRDIDFRVLLRFPQTVKNQGTSDFLPVKPRYDWDWHSCHQHYHSMDAFSNYDLLDAVAGHKVAEGHKASFCLEDTSCDPGFRRRYACTSHTQGLSPGCYDVYAANIDCQWIDITDVPPGNYVLKVTVNPDFHVLESDFANNIVRCDVIYTGVYVQTRHCRVTSG